MKTIIFNETQLAPIFETIRRSLFEADAADQLYQISNFQQSFDDESEISSFTYGINQDAAQDIEGYLTALTEGMAYYFQKHNLLTEDLIKEITDIHNDHIMIINNENDSLQIHFNDRTITCILHLTGQY